MQQVGTASRHGLDRAGIANLSVAHWNLGVPQLYEHALRRREGMVTQGGAFAVRTGVYTGRSPKDKFFAEEPGSRDHIAWGSVNVAMPEARFEALYRRFQAYFQGREAYVLDSYVGADPRYRLKVRVVTENAWHNLFARNMFIRPAPAELADFEPEFTILQAPNFQCIPAIDGTNSEVVIAVSFARRLVLIAGSHYAGEIKKSVFTVLNYLLPERGVLPMHCSANIGPRGDTAIFFGLSGTGKTTLSADPARRLIGDDEHGWSDQGIFNFEGGCYAKVIKLSAEAEPEIFATTGRFGTVLENVVVDPDSRKLDLDDGRFTENTRASYPIDFIPNIAAEGRGGQPANVVMLTADAFGVLPPISKLTPEQAMYHFLSGYTARVAGTEKGMGNEPQATFSTCFGAPFMPRHPSVYAKMLGERIARYGANCWLVNTGWSGGGYGVGQRFRIAHTRAMIRAALEGKLASVAVARDPNFGLFVPNSCPDVPVEVLNPRSTWVDKKAYDQAALSVAKRFETNFKQFEPHVDDRIKSAAIHAAA